MPRSLNGAKTRFVTIIIDFHYAISYKIAIRFFDGVKINPTLIQPLSRVQNITSAVQCYCFVHDLESVTSSMNLYITLSLGL